MSALLMATIIAEKAQRALNISKGSTHCYVDSSVVYYQMKRCDKNGATSLRTAVGNMVAKILLKTKFKNIHYFPGELNSADRLTRSITTEKLFEESSYWFKPHHAFEGADIPIFDMSRIPMPSKEALEEVGVDLSIVANVELYDKYINERLQCCMCHGNPFEGKVMVHEEYVEDGKCINSKKRIYDEKAEASLSLITYNKSATAQHVEERLYHKALISHKEVCKIENCSNAQEKAQMIKTQVINLSLITTLITYFYALIV